MPDPSVPHDGSAATAALSRRRLLQAAAVAGAGVGAGTLLGPAPRAFGAPGLRASRPEARWGVQSGEVTADSAVVWSKTDRPARMTVEVAATESFRGTRGRWAVDVGPGSDHAGKVVLRGLPAGTELFYRVQFTELSHAGHASEPLVGRLVTAPADRRDVSFAWSGDVAGQGWGINPDLGGMTGFEAIRRLRPDFFIHSGDSVYADGPLQEQVVLPDGSVWRNVVTPEKSKVAETLDEYRGQYRYNLLDDNVRRFAAEVPQLVQWDDHEVTNNWYPGEVLTDDRYTVKNVDTLAARARRAFLEYMPIAGNRIDRTLPYGPLVDVFALDLRTYRGPNSANLAAGGPEARIFGGGQLGNLARQLRSSRALWKVIASDMPLGLVVPDGPVDQEGIANRDPGQPLGRELEVARLLSTLKRDGVRNVVWLTADVHYTAAHHYDPQRAAFSDFDPFWEFVSGPLHAGTFGPNELDGTFGPEVVFSRHAERPNQPPSDGLQFVGHVRIDGASGVMTVELRNTAGAVLHTTELTPA
ncbi:alkaline phosphatase D family protein [Blastococcus xanthinilyticus]|uniref:Alkaline phosphatase D n=1 Tax=Blastococcus xanthinilyticus TaxID=1564164 RepID=A0A5S5CYX4_9ACTN|nr:alkaline phosphatase D family protein [Blastococcus xanthinilyticus]TYP88967.1 alkaline phosphatase D [Blastococcus xanthinilyticus]